MRVIDADKLKIKLRAPCQKCAFNGAKFCKACEINDFIDYIDSTPTIEDIISATDFKKRLNNMEYIYLQDSAEDIIDAIDCELTYFKEKQNGK